MFFGQMVGLRAIRFLYKGAIRIAYDSIIVLKKYSCAIHAFGPSHTPVITSPITSLITSPQCVAQLWEPLQIPNPTLETKTTVSP